MKIEFTKDYAIYKKGDTAEVKGSLLSRLISIHKVAKEYKEPIKRQTKDLKAKKKTK